MTSGMVGIYEERFVAFLDVLGFAQLVDDSVRNTGRAESIKALLRTVARIASNPVVGKLTAFSDSMVFSAPNVHEVFLGAIAMQRMLLGGGYLLRGAISSGPLHHEGAVVFGPAMVRAYRIESEAAIYPRIVIDRQTLSRLTPEDRKLHFEPDADGQWFISLFKKWPAGRDEAEALRSQLLRGQREAERSDNAGVIAKWQWTILRFNAALAKDHRGVDPIEVGS